MMVTLGGIGHFILIIACVAALLNESSDKRKWWKFVGGGFLALAYLALIVAARPTALASKAVGGARISVIGQAHTTSVDDGHLLNVRGKRPKFPSGAESRLGLTIVSWLSQRDREGDVEFAGGDRLPRSGGS